MVIKFVSLITKINFISTSVCAKKVKQDRLYSDVTNILRPLTGTHKTKKIPLWYPNSVVLIKG